MFLTLRRFLPSFKASKILMNLPLFFDSPISSFNLKSIFISNNNQEKTNRNISCTRFSIKKRFFKPWLKRKKNCDIFFVNVVNFPHESTACIKYSIKIQNSWRTRTDSTTLAPNDLNRGKKRVLNNHY